MAVLTTQLERDGTFARRGAEADGAPRRRAAGANGARRARRRREGGRAAPVAGQADRTGRIDRLLDPGTAFLELNALAAWELYDGAAPSAGIVTGISVIEGQECVVVANDATVKGGSYFRSRSRSTCARRRWQARPLPCVYLVDSGGRSFPCRPSLPRPRALRRIFYNQARMSAKGISQIAVGDGVVHRGRRLRAGDERRDGDRARHRDDLHRRPAAREGGDGAGRDRRGARRRRRAHAARGSPTTSPPPARRPRARAPDRPQPARGARSCPGTSHRRAARARPRRPLRARAGGLQARDGRARADRADRRRQPLRRVQGALRRDARLRLRRIEGYPVGILANKGVLFAESAQKGAHFIELAAKRGRCRSSSSRTSPASWSARSTRRAGSRATAPSSSRRSPARTCPSSPSSREARWGQATARCAVAPTGRDSFGCGRTRYLGDGRRAGGDGAHRGR